MSYGTERHTFAEDNSIPRGILAIIARIADNSITTCKQRKEAAQKYYKALRGALERRESEKEEVV